MATVQFTSSVLCLFLFLFFFFIEKCILVLSNGSTALFTKPTNLFFTKNFIKDGSHCTIHTFKNYFATVFSIFSKISSIQTDSKYLFKWTITFWTSEIKLEVIKLLYGDIFFENDMVTWFKYFDLDLSDLNSNNLFGKF